jgi:hypothetical protein
LALRSFFVYIFFFLFRKNYTARTGTASIDFRRCASGDVHISKYTRSEHRNDWWPFHSADGMYHTGPTLVVATSLNREQYDDGGGWKERSIIHTHTHTHEHAPLRAVECMPSETAKHHSRGILNDLSSNRRRRSVYKMIKRCTSTARDRVRNAWRSRCKRPSRPHDNNYSDLCMFCALLYNIIMCEVFSSVYLCAVLSCIRARYAVVEIPFTTT